MQTPPLILAPHTPATLSLRRKLNICLFSTSKLGCAFHFFSGQVWDSLATAEFNLRTFFKSCGDLGIEALFDGPRKPPQDHPRCSIDETRSRDPCAELPGRMIEAHHTWEHQRLASIEKKKKKDADPESCLPLSCSQAIWIHSPQMRAYFSKRLSHVRRPDPAPVFSVCAVCVIEPKKGARLEQSTSRSRLNSLFGESHVPTVVCFHSLANVGSCSFQSPQVFVNCSGLTLKSKGHCISVVFLL